jgi:hypothetical protein
MHYFSALFGKELCMFRTDLLSIIRSLNTVFTESGICHTSCVACLRADSQRPSMTNTNFCEYSINTPDDGQ